MRRSDPRPVSDDVLRVIACELAEAAPPAPAWDAIDPSADVDRRRAGGTRQFLLVAALALVIAGGLWYAQRPDELAPADVPPDPTDVPTVTLPPAEPTFESLDALGAQRCLTRRNARLVIDSGLLALGNAESLPGYTVDRARLTAYLPMTSAWAGIVGHADVPPIEAAEIEAVLAAYRAADAEAFAGPNGTEGAEFGAAVDAFEADLTAHLSRFDDPVECSPPAVTPTPVAARREGRCVALWRLRDAIDRLAPIGSLDDDAVVEGAAEALRRWFEPVPDEIAQVSDQLTALLDLSAAERRAGGVAEVTGAVDAIATQWTTESCSPTARPIATTESSQP